MVNTLAFSGREFSVVTTQLCCAEQMQLSIESVVNEHDVCHQNFIYYNNNKKTMAGGICPVVVF